MIYILKLFKKNFTNLEIIILFKSLGVIWKNISQNLKKKIYKAILLNIINGLTDVFSIATLLPFLTVISNPKLIKDSQLLRNFIPESLISNENGLLIFLTLIFIFSAILTSCIRLINIRFINRTTADIVSEINCKVYYTLLNRKYIQQIQDNSSLTIARIHTFGGQLVTVLQGTLLFLSTFITSFFLISSLIIINWKICLFTSLSFILVYGLIVKRVNKKFNILSKKIVESEKKVIKNIQENIGGIREIILRDKGDIFFQRFKAKVKEIRNSQATSSTLSFSPKYIVEASALITIASLACYVQIFERNEYFLPLLGAFALAIQKLMPMVQQLFASYSSVLLYKYALEEITSVLQIKNSIKNYESNQIKPFNIKKGINIKNISYFYPNKKEPAIEDISFEIFKGDSIGLIGKTGSGKSTLIDNIMGLLTPTKGTIEVDDKNITTSEKLMEKWRNSISQVPQHVYLIEGTIAQNIAFTLKNSEIDFNKLEKVTEVAILKDLIKTLPEGFNSNVGERGIFLSGGQIQRIGIARALYNETAVLIFDEATSSLDENTESKVIDSIYKNNKSLICIVISHKKSTLKKCNKILKINNGKLEKVDIENFF